MAPMKLEWNADGTETTDGRYMIQSETVRGEPRFHWIEVMPPECRAVYRSSLKYDGSERRAQVRKRAQMLEDDTFGK